MQGLPVLLNPRGRHPQWLGLHSVDRVDQLLERHREIGVYYHLVEQVRIEELYPLRAVQDLVELFVLQMPIERNV